MGEVTVTIGFDAASRRVTIDGKPTGEPIEIGRVVAEGFDYQTEADRTNTIHWNPQHVNFDDFRRNVQAFVDIAGILNLYKKLLFRGKTPDELRMLQPREELSMAAHGGAIPPAEIDLVHGILGSMTENGELGEILLDMLDGKPADRINAIEEVGDNRWYLNRILRWADCDDLTCERMNIDKLHGRHGATFNTERDANRDLDAERARLVDGAAKPVERRFFGQPEAVVRRPIGDCEGMDC
jgi:hypothetical protein